VLIPNISARTFYLNTSRHHELPIRKYKKQRTHDAKHKTTTIVASRFVRQIPRQIFTSRTTRTFTTTSNMVKLVNSAEDFKKSIEKGVSVVDFYATWCGPCRVIAPKVVEFSKRYVNATYLKVDVDELADLAQEYGIRAMPTFMIFKDGQKVDELIGANPVKLEEKIKQYVQ
jgi:thioredoxin 1